MNILSARGLRKSYGGPPVVAGRLPESVVLHVAVLIGYAAVGYAIAIFFARKRFSD